MARKREEAAAPVVTSLPLPSSDSVLVIDLPDGQKLLGGKMSHGTVIEVATWRGTGRPDSRTNRLMLGMSSSDADAQLSAPESEENMVVDRRSVKYWIWLALHLTRKAREILIRISSKVQALFKKKSQATELNSGEKVEEDVQAWLENLKSKNAKAISKEIESTGKSIAPRTSSPARKSTKKVAKKGKSRSKA